MNGTRKIRSESSLQEKRYIVPKSPRVYKILGVTWEGYEVDARVRVEHPTP